MSSSLVAANKNPLSTKQECGTQLCIRIHKCTTCPIATGPKLWVKPPNPRKHSFSLKGAVCIRRSRSSCQLCSLDQSVSPEVLRFAKLCSSRFQSRKHCKRTKCSARIAHIHKSKRKRSHINRRRTSLSEVIRQ